MTTHLRPVLVAAALTSAAVVALAHVPRAAAAGPQPPAAVDLRAEVAPPADFAPLAARARADGSVRVLVALRVAWSAAGARAPADLARARAELLATMPTAGYRVVRTYDVLPFVALELTPEGLVSLERGGRAARIHEDALMDLDLDGTTAVVEATETTVLGFTGAGRRVAVLDSGVDGQHPFLAGRVETILSACFTSNDCPNGVVGPGAAEPCTYTPNSDACQHGTHVAGIVAGANGTNGAGVTFSGVAPGATIVPIKVFSKVFGKQQCLDDGDAFCPASYTSDVVKGMEWASQLGNVDAVNMSLGYGAFDAPCTGKQHFYTLLATALLVLNGTAVVASAGNDGDLPGGKNGIGSPACVPGVISVGRTDDADMVAPTSQSVPSLSLLAPGSGVLSSMNGTFDTFSGTSMSAPHVAGAIAVLRQRVPGATPAQLLAALQQTGLPVTDPANGITTPRLRLLAALVSFGDTGFRNSYAAKLEGGKLFSDGISARNMPTSSQTITISGLQPGDVVQRAFLYFMTAGEADEDGAVLLNGWQFGGTLVGAARVTCGVAGGGATRVYRADVTAKVTGNGTYTVNEIAPVGVGASLVVVTANLQAAYTRNVIVRAGAMTGLAGETMTHQFAVGGPVTDVELHAGLGDGDSTTEQAMLLGGAAAFGANAFSGTDGGDWDDRTQSLGSPLTSFVVANGKLENRLTTGTDCLSWAYSGIAYRDA